MAEDSLITNELKALVGVSWEPQVYKVEEGAIKRYAEAIDDTNPLFNDIDYAKRSRYGRLMCPPGFAGWPEGKDRLLGIQVSEAVIAAGAPPRPLDGGIDFEFFLPIGAGDTLVETTKITDISERKTKAGNALFVRAEYTYVNESGDVALKSTATYIYR